MPERRKAIAWNLAGLLFLSFHKILILCPIFSVHNSVSLAWAAGNKEAEWLCRRRASPLGIRKAWWCFAYTHQRNLFHSILDIHLFLHIFILSPSVLWAPLCVRHGASPQQNTGEENHLTPCSPDVESQNTGIGNLWTWASSDAQISSETSSTSTAFL